MAYVAHTSKTKNNFKLDKQESKVSTVRIAANTGNVSTYHKEYILNCTVVEEIQIESVQSSMSICWKCSRV